MSAKENFFVFKGTFKDLTEKVKDEKGLIVLDFSAKWCSPCKKLNAILPNIAKNNKEVLFFKIDIDDNSELAEKYEIRSVPVVKYMKIKEGKLAEIDSLITFDEGKLLSKIETLKIC